MMTFFAQKMHGSAQSDLSDVGGNVTFVRHLNHLRHLCHFGYGFIGLGLTRRSRGHLGTFDTVPFK